MRLREFLFGTALMSIALVTTRAGAPTVLSDDCRPDFAGDARSTVAPTPRVSPPAARPPLISQDKVLGSAYHDIVSILSSNNSCSDFFGGLTSVDAFNELASRIRKNVLTVGISMRMSGPTTNVHDARTKKNYRIFDKVSLNSNGSFYRNKAALWEPTVPRVGSFEPNSREARVLILLHELGHVMRGSDGRWLLPDDGQNEGLSRANSFKIEDICEKEINSLGKVITTKDLGKYKNPDPQSIRSSTGEGTQP